MLQGALDLRLLARDLVDQLLGLLALHDEVGVTPGDGGLQGRDLLDGLGRLLADLVVEGDARRQIVEAARREGHVEVLGDRLLVHVDQLRGQLLVGHRETVAGARNCASLAVMLDWSAVSRCAAAS